jgi:hypothetical protein
MLCDRQSEYENPGNLLGQGVARTLHDIALDSAEEPDGADDQPAIVGHDEFPRPDLA